MPNLNDSEWLQNTLPLPFSLKSPQIISYDDYNFLFGSNNNNNIYKMRFNKNNKISFKYHNKYPSGIKIMKHNVNGGIKGKIYSFGGLDSANQHFIEYNIKTHQFTVFFFNLSNSCA